MSNNKDINLVKKKIFSAKIHEKPFPVLIIRNFLPKKIFKDLSKALPSYNDLNGGNIFIQSKSGSKRSVFIESNYFKKIMKKEIAIKNTINIFKKLEPAINKKFSQQIDNNINKFFINTKTNFSCSFSSCIKSYVKSVHIDRREHKFHILYYPNIQKNSGGELCLWASEDKDTYDVFPDERKLKLSKTIKPSPNTCLITLNTPNSYHSVKRYTGKKERKYIYAVYDFPTTKENYHLKSRSNGNNANIFWKKPVKVYSQRRLKNFLAA